MLRIAHALEAQLTAALERAFPDQAAVARQGGGRLDPQLAAASKPEFGDFQANGALALAKPLRQAPRAIASALVAELGTDPSFTELCLEPQIAGPGFINLTLRPERLAAELAQRLDDPRLGVPSVREPGSDSAGAGDRGLLQPQHRQGDARGAPALHDHRRLPGPGAGVSRPSGAAAQPRGRLGHPVRHADHPSQAGGAGGPQHRRRGGPGRSGGLLPPGQGPLRCR